ncbi:BT_3987 domain-containing protein [Parapedobacter sp. 2B3]|uniref:BT_3987 domain-containing protein n=1 Tax=Parapedobacter sp. 2B3 TaxID=3342381 RepID=UPI0035B579CE
MNNIKNISIGLGLALLTLACGKDTGFENPDRFAQVYMTQAYDLPNIKNLAIESDAQPLYFGASFGGVNYPSQDVRCRFEIAPDLVTTYNAANFTTYELLPEASYTVESLEAVLKKGELSSDVLRIDVHTEHESIDARKQYMLPVRLAAAEGGQYPVNEQLRVTYFVVRTAYTELSKTSWEVASFSSEETVGEGPDNGHAKHAIDGNPDTFWHTQYRDANPAHPHYLVIDLGSTQALHGLRIFGRSSWAPGRPLDIEILVSDDEVNWIAAGAYALDGDVAENEVSFIDNGQKTIDGRYIKIVVNRSFTGSNHTCIAEVEAF